MKLFSGWNLIVLTWLVSGCAVVPQQEPASLSSGAAHEADRAAFEEHGYHHARERFLQMDSMRRATSGRLAELFGAGKLENDRKSYSLGLPQILPQMRAKLAEKYPQILDLLNAYAAGVNRYLDEMRVAGSGTPARQVLDFYRGLTKDPAYLPARWDAVDSIAANLTLSFGLTNALEETLALGAVYRKLYAEKGHPEAFADFLDARPVEPFVPMSHPSEKSAFVPAVPGIATVFSPAGLPPTYTCRSLGFPFDCSVRSPGSNTWAVSSKLLAAGRGTAAILASDPHLPLKSPSFYLETTIDSANRGGTFNVTGESIPGIPGIAIGHNEHIAWGVTNSMAHVDQVYLETLDSSGEKVRFKDQWVGLTQEEYPIAVREPGGRIRQEKILVRSVPHHGTLFSEHWPELGKLGPSTRLSYRWAGFDEGGSLDIAATIELNRAADFPQFQKAVAINGTSAGNYLYADTRGNIGYSQHGRYPLRASASAAAPPFIPLPGDGRFEWTGYRTVFPEAYNPASGYLVVVNDDPWGRNLDKHFSDYQDYFSFKSTDGCRGKRIRDLLEAKRGLLTISDMKRIQFDHRDLLAARLVNEILRPLDRRGALKAFPAGKLLVRWDGEMDKGRTEPLVFAAWLSVMMARHFAAVVPLGVFPTIAETPAGIQTLYHQLTERYRADRAGTTRWIQGTLAETEAKLRETHRWGKSWGSDHHLTLVPLMGPPSAGPERDGSWLTVDVGGYAGAAKRDGGMPDAFADTYGANFRLISELNSSGAIATLAVLPGGVEGDEKRYSEGTYREAAPLMAATTAVPGERKHR